VIDNNEELIYRSYRQGGKRYEHAVKADGRELRFEFEDGLYMLANPLWAQLEPGASFQPINPEAIFGNANPLFVEIGIGNGEFIAHHAGNEPQQNWVGFEVFHKIFHKAVARCHKVSHGNIRLMQFDAELFVRLLPDKSVSGFYVNFPDPWPKSKHTKRRLLKTWFMELMSQKLRDDGLITVATDHDDYAREITENFAAAQSLESALAAPFVNEIGDYYQTKYYRKFAAQGTVYFYQMRKKSLRGSA
jgi:tRNA (guanine-N7-)-methyltransferase